MRDIDFQEKWIDDDVMKFEGQKYFTLRGQNIARKGAPCDVSPRHASHETHRYWFKAMPAVTMGWCNLMIAKNRIYLFAKIRNSLYIISLRSRCHATRDAEDIFIIHTIRFLFSLGRR